jgi:pyruvate/2-oxoglutarate dehydrogenase complex dihydrolipoamide dehydrogenase (E3) component
VSTEDGACQIEAERIYINTGARPATLALEGADDKRIYDSTGLLQLDSLPARLVIVGGGYISLEFACMYAAFVTEVTILEQGDTFLAREDRDVAEAMLAMLADRGVKVVLQAETKRFVPGEEAVTVVTSQGEYAAEAVLVAIGRRPNVEALHLEAAGVQLTPRGFIQTDEYLRAAPHIWAMGDVAGSPQFTYVSLDDYRIVRDQILGEGKRTTKDRLLLPTSVFTTPALSQVGMTETMAAASGRPYEVKRLQTVAIPKAKVLGETHGLLKAIVDTETGLILGATLFCSEAHELINLLKLAMDHQIPAEALRTQIFTHPTIAEALNDLFASN